MAVIINAKGTSVPYFKIGKQGTTLYQGDTDPNNTYTVSTNDVWIDSNNETIKFRTSSSTWSELASTSTISDLTDIDLTGIANGYFLRYDSASSTWKPHETTGGLADDWGVITTSATSYDGYTGDVWSVNTGTSTASYDDNVSVGGNITVVGTVDGRDVATDGTKLDTIETSATADQTQSEINALGITATGLSGTPDVSVGNITATGYLRGPSSFTIDPATHGDDTGTLVIAGNLQVDGTTTTVNSTTVSIDDLNFSIATDAADSAAANGAGITIGGAGATLNYTHATTSWDMNKPLNVTGDVDTSGLLKVGTNNTEYANNYLRNKASGTYYFDNNTVGQDFNFRVSGSSALDTTAMTIDSSGKVGIGETSPSQKLQVAGNILLETSGNPSITNKTTGSGNNPTFRLQADTHYWDFQGTFSNANDELMFMYDGSTKLTIDSSGNVGIGSASDGAILQLDKASSSYLDIQSDSTLRTRLYNDSAQTILETTTNNLIFKSASSEAMRIDSSGNVAIGHTTTTGSKFAICDGANSQIQFFPEVTTDTNLIQHYDPTSATYINADYRGATHQFKIGTTERLRIDSSGIDVTGDISGTSNGAVGYNIFSDWAGMQFAVTSNHYLGFKTNNTERLRIDSSGNVLVGKTTAGDSAGSQIEPAGTGYFVRIGGPSIICRRNGNTGEMIRLVDDGTTVGTISTGGSTTSYNTSSDYRLKENVVPMTGSIDRLKELKPSKFNFIADADTTVDGFLAHEVSDTVPEAISGEKDAMRTEEYEVEPAVLDDDGEVVTEAVTGTQEVPDMQGIDQSKLVPLLVSALQEAITRIEILENK